MNQIHWFTNRYQGCLPTQALGDYINQFIDKIDPIASLSLRGARQNQHTDVIEVCQPFSDSVTFHEGVMMNVQPPGNVRKMRHDK